MANERTHYWLATCVDVPSYVVTEEERNERDRLSRAFSARGDGNRDDGARATYALWPDHMAEDGEPCLILPADMARMVSEEEQRAIEAELEADPLVIIYEGPFVGEFVTTNDDREHDWDGANESIIRVND